VHCNLLIMPAKTCPSSPDLLVIPAKAGIQFSVQIAKK